MLFTIVQRDWDPINSNSRLLFLFLFQLILFLGFEEDLNEAHTDDISQFVTTTPATESIPASHTAKNGAARRLLTILEKKKNQYFINLIGGLSSFDSLIPSNVEIFIRLYLTTPQKYFGIPASSSIRPKFRITQANLICEFVLLKAHLLQSMEARLARSFLQINFLAKFVKSYR